jgi:hypothetical protein
VGSKTLPRLDLDPHIDFKGQFEGVQAALETVKAIDAGLAPQRTRGSGTLQQPADNQHQDTDHDHSRRCDEKQKRIGGSAVGMMR